MDMICNTKVKPTRKLLSLQLSKMANCHLQNISFLHFVLTGTLFENRSFDLIRLVHLIRWSVRHDHCSQTSNTL